MLRGGNTYFYHFDGLGSVVNITDSSGNVVESYTYDAFGQVSIFDANHQPLTTSQIGNSYYFTARRLDSETGLYYYRARYYSPELGRFLTTDPVGYREGPNLYTYCRNNPVRYRDPLGLGTGSDGTSEGSDGQGKPLDEQIAEWMKEMEEWWIPEVEAGQRDPDELDKLVNEKIKTRETLKYGNVLNPEENKPIAKGFEELGYDIMGAGMEALEWVYDTFNKAIEILIKESIRKILE